MATGRDLVQTEFNNYMTNFDPDRLIYVDYWDEESDNPDVMHWQATLKAPDGCFYEGGYFKLEIIFPDTYPIDVPKIKFLTKIFHCNVGYDGGICLNILKKWKTFNPRKSIKETLESICILLYHQNPDSPRNGEAANLYNNNKKEFKKKCQEFVDKYANANDFGKQEIQGIVSGTNFYYVN